MAQNGTGGIAGRPAAAAALARGASVTVAAREAGVARGTVSRWQGDPAFMSDVERMQAKATDATAEQLAEAAAALARVTVHAVDVLAALLGADAERERRMAAVAILTLAQDLRRHVELEDRVAALEAATAGGAT